MKLITKAKELEDIKYQNIVKSQTKVVNMTQKVKSTIRTYISGNSKSKFKITNNKYKNELNKTINQVKSMIPNKVQRSNSALNINKKINQMEPQINKFVEDSLNKLYKNVLKSYENGLDKRSLSTVKKNIKNRLMTSLKSNRLENKENIRNLTDNNEHNKFNENRQYTENKFINKNNDKQFNSICFNNSINKEDKVLMGSPGSINDDILSNRNMIRSSNNNNLSQKFVLSQTNESINGLLNSNQMEKKMIDEIIKKNMNSNNTNINKFDLLKNINKEIDDYNKGLPQLISKVENTLEKINQNSILDKKLHPVIKLASKHCGKQIHLHLNELIEKILDDILLECVDYLEEIDKIGKKQKEFEKFSTFLSKYSQNFEFIKNFEIDIARKINENSYPKLDSNLIIPTSIPIDLQEESKFNRPNTKEMLIYQNVEMDKFKEENLNLTPNYKNPFSLEIEKVDGLKKKDFGSTLDYLNDKYKFEGYERKSRYSVCLNHNIIINAQKYMKGYKDYQITTGVYFKENIFSLYDDFVENLLKEIMDEEIEICLGDIDNFAEELYNNEIQENNL